MDLAQAPGIATPGPAPGPAPDAAAQIREPAALATPQEAPAPSKSHLVLTLGRVKTLIKEDADVKFVSAEAYFAIAKATEMVLKRLTEGAAAPMLQSGRAQLAYNDVSHAVAQWKSLDFLEDTVPCKIPAAVALQRMVQGRLQPGPS